MGLVDDETIVRPAWLSIAQVVDGPILEGTEKALRESPLVAQDLDLSMIPQAALFHLRACVETGLWANGQGYHSVALGMFRQAVEALSLVDTGLQPPSFSRDILSRWKAGKKSLGEIRKDLEAQVWGRYRSGLWNEPWTDFFGNLARAIQPFAHYTPDLMNWQQYLPQQDPKPGPDGKLVILARFGRRTNDRIKATRVYLLSALVVWTVARLLIENRPDWDGPKSEIENLGRAIAASKLLGHGQNWSDQLMGNVFFKPGFDWSDRNAQ